MSVSLSTLRQMLALNYVANINTFISGKPGIGKTQTIEAFAQDMKERDPDFQFHRFYGPTMSPMDIQSTAPDFNKSLLVFFNNESLPNAYKEPDAHGALFFGELHNTDPMTVKLLQKYVNGEDMNGVLRKPDGIRVISDGNRLSDKSGVLQQSRAFMSRFMRIEVEVPVNDAIEYMTNKQWHPTVITFLDRNPEYVDNYDSVFSNSATEEARAGVWANMRSWERVSQLEKAAETMECVLGSQHYAGNVGTAVAMQYLAFKEVLFKLPPIEEIYANPTTVSIPNEISSMFAMATMIALRATEEVIDAVITLIYRFPIEIQIHMARKLIVNPATRKIVRKNPRYDELLSTPKFEEILGD